MTLEYLISHYGHVALVIGTFLEGEGILNAAGAFRAAGRNSVSARKRPLRRGDSSSNNRAFRRIK